MRNNSPSLPDCSFVAARSNMSPDARLIYTRRELDAKTSDGRMYVFGNVAQSGWLGIGRGVISSERLVNYSSAKKVSRSSFFGHQQQRHPFFATSSPILRLRSRFTPYL
jgi:hypothetical protein